MLVGFPHLYYAKVVKKTWLKTKNKKEQINKVSVEDCECPVRTEIPEEESWNKIDRTEKAILDHFRSSAFNTCRHREIPTIEVGDSLKLHIESGAKPPNKKVKFSKVLINLQEEVKEQLEEDVRLGVIEKVAELAQADDKPTSWAARMITVIKKNGKIRE